MLVMHKYWIICLVVQRLELSEGDNEQSSTPEFGFFVEFVSFFAHMFIGFFLLIDLNIVGSLCIYWARPVLFVIGPVNLLHYLNKGA